jgi:CRISPR-associated protein Cmr1
MDRLLIQLRTLTPLWTGGVDQTCDRLHETGLIGSLRWWYEALVRGLGGYACDPTDEDRCPDNDGKHCAACELFGCTGWARKFRLRVLDKQGRVINGALGANTVFQLEFLELRPIMEEEKWLLIKAVEIAAKYGALGGKTTLKPQSDQRVGRDYGIVQVISSPELQRPDVERFLSTFRKVQPENAPGLCRFFFVRGAFLWRKQMNILLGQDEKGNPIQDVEDWQNFLRGKRGSTDEGAVSKKLFSFRAGGGRIWGYARDDQMRDEIITQIERTLGKGNYTVKTGKEVLHEL